MLSSPLPHRWYTHRSILIGGTGPQNHVLLTNFPIPTHLYPRIKAATSVTSICNLHLDSKWMLLVDLPRNSPAAANIPHEVDKGLCTGSGASPHFSFIADRGNGFFIYVPGRDINCGSRTILLSNACQYQLHSMRAQPCRSESRTTLSWNMFLEQPP